MAGESKDPLLTWLDSLQICVIRVPKSCTLGRQAKGEDAIARLGVSDPQSTSFVTNLVMQTVGGSVTVLEDTERGGPRAFRAPQLNG